MPTATSKTARWKLPKLRGECLKLLHYQAPEILLAGPAGTGKSTACLTKLHAICGKVAGIRALMCRKTRESLTETGLVTFENFVVSPDHPIFRSGGQRKNRQSYHYPNGSELVIGGLDKASKTLSSDYDLVYVNECTELTEADWEMLLRPLRHNVLPYQQILADCNPDSPTHWMKKRCDAQRCLLLESRHEDNPALWDEERQDWTPAGRTYIFEKLESLTGHRYMRLRHGRWVQSEGVVYPGWDARIHLIDRFDIPRAWPRYWAIDFGFNNPFVCQRWAQDPDGRLFMYREHYQTQALVEDHARAILADCGVVTLANGKLAWPGDQEPQPAAIVCDHDAEGRATLERYLEMSTIPAYKVLEAADGIDLVASRLKPQRDGKPRLFIMRDSLVRRDPNLVDSKRPVCTVEEFDAYVWDTHKTGQIKGQTKDEPFKANDHGMDGIRYLVTHLDYHGTQAEPYLAPREERDEEEWRENSNQRKRGLWGLR